MRLKFWTTASFVFGLSLLLGWPFIVGRRPGQDAPKVELARYGIRVLEYFGATCLVFLVTAVLAIILFRRTREEVLREARANMAELIEGTLRDHGRKDN